MTRVGASLWRAVRFVNSGATYGPGDAPGAPGESRPRVGLGCPTVLDGPRELAWCASRAQLRSSTWTLAAQQAFDRQTVGSSLYAAVELHDVGVEMGLHILRLPRTY